ncbi:MAG: hypothetical protein CML13_17890 [Puniceicoccaceae bacterium]|nr:hypothetical protein [Puniceicoccaceae bacterium]
MKTINHPEFPELLYYQDEDEQHEIEKRKNESLLAKVMLTLFPKATCSKCKNRMKKKWMGRRNNVLFLVCDDCHSYVETDISTD